MQGRAAAHGAAVLRAFLVTIDGAYYISTLQRGHAHKTVDILDEFSFFFFFIAKKLAKESFAKWSKLGQAGMLLASVGVRLQYDILRKTA